MKQINSFGHRLVVARGATESRAAITQKELAASLGISDKTISAWESARGIEPALKVIERVANALGVTPGWLAFGQEPRYPAGPPPLSGLA